MEICDIERWIEKRFPESTRCSWDHDGLLICPDRHREVKKIVTCLDVSFDVIEQAAQLGAELIVSHHPLIFNPVDRICEATPVGQKIILMLSHGISLYSLHTRLDAGGLNDLFAETLGILPDPGIILSPEEPGIGGMGVLPEKISPREFARMVSGALHAPVTLYSADMNLSRVAYCCGSGKDFVSRAVSLGADAYVSGDLPYHVVRDAVEQGMTVIDCGHHASEKASADLLCEILKEMSPFVQIHAISESVWGEKVDFSQPFLFN